MSEEKNHYLSKKESRKIASENKRFIRVLEKNKRRKAGKRNIRRRSRTSIIS